MRLRPRGRLAQRCSMLGMLVAPQSVMLKQVTFSALTGGALVLAYAAWSKWRGHGGTPSLAQPSLSDSSRTLGSADEARRAEASEASVESAPVAVATPTLELEPIDLVLDDLWSVEEAAPNSREQLLDFSSELDDDDCSVAPEGLGVRWLTRATEALSPFNRELSLREEAEAALLEERASDLRWPATPGEERDSLPSSRRS